ncbi:MAG: TlpA family protein disulfide reductase [Phycisphaerae bacterium]|nr:TlpA family protein disulfide reductase [Phycisphaerae bacterium]
MKKLFKRILYLFLLCVLLFVAFMSGVILTSYVRRKDQQRYDAWSAKRVMECTELVREGLNEDAIRRLDNVSSDLLFRSAYDKDHTEMKELQEDILSVWQEAKVYYEKYDVQGSRHSMVGPVENKLDYVPFSWREKTRRQFEAKYKGGILQVVPELEIVQWFGPELSLVENRDNIVLLDFWGTQCGPCLKGMPKVQQLYETYKDKGLVVVTMTFPGDNNEAIQRIISENNYTFRVAKAKMSTIEEYAVAAIPTYFLIDKQGRLAWGPEHEVPSIETIDQLLR